MSSTSVRSPRREGKGATSSRVVAEEPRLVCEHMHVPWGMPAILLDMFFLAYPTKRYRSAWIGIAVHSAQSVVLAILILTLVV